MDTRKLVLYVILSLIVYFIWNTWQIDHPQKISNQISNNSLNNTKSNNLLPELPDNKYNQSNTNNKQSFNKLIIINTDVMKLKIDMKYGDIVYASLLKYPISVEKNNQPMVLLTNKLPYKYTANSGLLSNQSGIIKNIDFHYQTEKYNYNSTDFKNNIIKITLNGKTSDNILIKKVFTFNKNNYLINISYEIDNHSNKKWKSYLNTQLLKTSPKEDESGLFHIGSYTGASYSDPTGSHYQKISFKKMTQSDLNTEINSGWLAMQQHYFLSSWIPNKNSINTFYTKTINNDYIIGAVSKSITVTPNTSKIINTQLYIGPEIAETLKNISPHLDLTIDYGFLWFLSSMLFTLMKAIYNVIGNWGWSIVLVTFLIKLSFYKLSATSYNSMAGMRNLQPKLQALRERFGDDKARLSQATMELYRQEKINPLGGCLPILVQIPVFIALYWVLLESVALRQSAFIFWINDLSATDSLHVLPIIMGITMLIQQKLNPTPPDPMQAKIMMFLPVLFIALFWNFPSGLVLYWIVNNTLSILQQWYISNKYNDNKQIIKNNNFKKSKIKQIN